MDMHALAARHAIMNCLANHSRGVDRADANLLGHAYWPDATVDYGFYAGPAPALVDMLAAGQKGSLPTLHRSSNTDIRVAGNRATSESYVIAYVEDADLQRMVFGRYLDRHEQRGGEWKLSHRTYVLDGNTNHPTTARRADPPVSIAHFAPHGAKGAADAGRALLAHHTASTARPYPAPPAKGTPMPADSAPQNAAPPHAATPDAAMLDAALSRDASRRLITAYCRGVDRGDAGLLASIFWDDATVVSGIVNGPGATFARDVVAHVTTHLGACFHAIGNE
ncbi:MAG: nuclear transport factor 2 family protein, partial [Sphingopyxis sp.]